MPRSTHKGRPHFNRIFRMGHILDSSSKPTTSPPASRWGARCTGIEKQHLRRSQRQSTPSIPLVRHRLCSIGTRALPACEMAEKVWVFCRISLDEPVQTDARTTLFKERHPIFSTGARSEQVRVPRTGSSPASDSHRTVRREGSQPIADKQCPGMPKHSFSSDPVTR